MLKSNKLSDIVLLNKPKKEEEESYITKNYHF